MESAVSHPPIIRYMDTLCTWVPYNKLHREDSDKLWNMGRKELVFECYPLFEFQKVVFDFVNTLWNVSLDSVTKPQENNDALIFHIETQQAEAVFEARPIPPVVTTTPTPTQSVNPSTGSSTSETVEIIFDPPAVGQQIEQQPAVKVLLMPNTRVQQRR